MRKTIDCLPTGTSMDFLSCTYILQYFVSKYITNKYIPALYSNLEHK